MATCSIESNEEANESISNINFYVVYFLQEDKYIYIFIVLFQKWLLKEKIYMYNYILLAISATKLW